MKFKGIMRYCLLTAIFVAGQLYAADNLPDRNWIFASFGKKAEGTVNYSPGMLTISTQNTKNAFFEADEYSFAYIPQAFLHDDCSRSVITVTVDNVPMGSAGVMMRANDSRGSANVHLEANAAGDLFVFFRQKEDGTTYYRRLGRSEFPVQMRLTRQGNTFMSHYRNGNGDWIKGPSVFVDLGESQLQGFYACSGNDNQIGYDVDSFRKMQVTFRDWTMDYEDNYIPAEENYVIEPAGKNVLLRENFADGSLCNTPESNVNPVWNGIRYAELPYTEDGARYWRKRGDGIYYMGDKKWADYEISLDFSFPEAPAKTMELMLQTRYQEIAMYDKMVKYYGVSLQNGDEVILNKYKSAGNTVEPMKKAKVASYADGERHQLKIRVMDMDYEVLLDGVSIIKGVDANAPITYGNVGFKFTDCDINIYRIEVVEIEDAINGREDNYLLDYYDTPIPDYIKEYMN